MVSQNRQRSIVTPWQDGRTQMLQREISGDGLLIGNQDYVRLPSLYQAPPLHDRVAAVCVARVSGQHRRSVIMAQNSLDITNSLTFLRSGSK